VTALTVSADAAADAGLRPVPWRRMAGIIWRQHRYALAGEVVVLGAVALALWLVGYTYWTRYQPGSRFWPFQWIESGWLLTLSVLLTAAAVWRVGRRAT
jgi:hypothetical protein